MKVLKKDKLIEFIKVHPDAEQPLRAWVDAAQSATFVEEIVRSFRQVKLSQTGITFRISSKPYFLSARIKSPAIFIEAVTATRKSFRNQIINL